MNDSMWLLRYYGGESFDLILVSPGGVCLGGKPVSTPMELLEPLRQILNVAHAQGGFPVKMQYKNYYENPCEGRA
ncbi:hypothetical protein [Geobacter sp.]|uniref:hypothetical protein n=1 Tax=Geobacter sp. TaxID=46610 RepID=UPI002636E435|nr:hypothetical protein [Geobacter sp.]